MVQKYKEGQHLHITFEAVVTRLFNTGGIQVEIPNAKDSDILLTRFEVEACTIEVLPEPLKVGDTVTWGNGAIRTIIKAIDGHEAWVGNSLGKYTVVLALLRKVEE